jgi:hypothetical protein
MHETHRSQVKIHGFRIELGKTDVLDGRMSRPPSGTLVFLDVLVSHLITYHAYDAIFKRYLVECPVNQGM